MKKHFKTLLLGLLLIPCMLFCACTKDISQSEYGDRMAEAARVYYQDKAGKSITINTSANSNSSWKESVDYGVEDENASVVDFSSKECTTQKIEIFRSKDANQVEYTNIRVTEKVTITTRGFEEKEDESGLEAVTSVSESTIVTTFVSTVEELGITGKAYISRIESIDGVAGEEQKSVYTYMSSYEFLNDIEEIIEDVNSEIFDDGFFGSGHMISRVYGGDTEFYANKDKNFGVNYSIPMNHVYAGSISKSTMSFNAHFENGLPSKISSTEVNEIINEHLDVLSDINKLSELNGTTTISYSCSVISEPAGFEEANSTINSPDIIVISIAPGISL